MAHDTHEATSRWDGALLQGIKLFYYLLCLSLFVFLEITK